MQFFCFLLIIILIYPALFFRITINTGHSIKYFAIIMLEKIILYITKTFVLLFFQTVAEAIKLLFFNILSTTKSLSLFTIYGLKYIYKKYFELTWSLSNYVNTITAGQNIRESQNTFNKKSINEVF